MSKLEQYVSWYDNILDTTSRQTATIESLLRSIRTGGQNHQLAERIRLIRADPSRRSELKKRLQVIMWQGIFSQRNKAGLQQLSGVMCIDIDHKATEELRYLRHILSQEPWVLAYFTSPSGDGLKVLVQSPVTTPEEYENCYAQVIEHFKLHYHCEVDQSCREYSKACYASHDPDLYVNDNAQDYPFRYNPDYDDKRAGDQNSPVPSGISRFEVHQPTVAESFINRLNSQINSLTDEQILNICDLKFHRYKQNYQVGNRRNSIFQQAAVLCRAGIESVKTLQYLESVFIPAGSPLHEIQAEVSKAYRTYGNLFGSERGNYKSYNEYKKQRSI